MLTGELDCFSSSFCLARQSKMLQVQQAYLAIGDDIRAFGKMLKLGLVSRCTIMARLTGVLQPEESDGVGSFHAQRRARCLMQEVTKGRMCRRVETGPLLRLCKIGRIGAR